MAVGVVGRGGLEVGGVDGAAVAVFEQGGVDDGGIGGQGHALARRLRKTPATRGRSESWLTSFSTREARMTVRGTSVRQSRR